MLESLAAGGQPLAKLRQIKVRFLKFIYLDRQLTIQLKQTDAAATKIVILDNKLPVIAATLSFGSRAGQPPPEVAAVIDFSETPTVLSMEQMVGRSGWLLPPTGSERFERAFPRASAALHPRRLSGLAQTSRLVGMVCPGLHSIYAELSAELTEDLGSREGIRFKTVRVDDRFRSVGMDVVGDGLMARVASFARRAPITGQTVDELTGRLPRDEFAGVTALVAGGSRGLGATTARIIAAGGGTAVITYAHGRDDALQLRDEINAFRGKDACTVVRFDATQPVGAQLASIGEETSQLYYFVTPQIFVQKAEVFSPVLFSRFIRFYVDAFYEVCDALFHGKLNVFYPSSVAVAQRPKSMTEYAMAKSAGEVLCTDLGQEMNGLRILVNRLPRILTDQTATVAHAESADAIDVMLPVIRAMCEA